MREPIPPAASRSSTKSLEQSAANRTEVGPLQASTLGPLQTSTPNLERALAFYREGLGLDSAGVIATEYVGDEENPAGDIAMFHLDGNLILALYPRTELAKDARIPFGPPKSGEFSLGHLVASEQDVDVLLARAEAAGATLTGPAHYRPWGIYSGYFRDPDGHLWEIIWNPRM